MSWRTVVITGVAKLDYRIDYLVVRKQDATQRIYIGEIGTLIIESTAVSMTTTLISELSKRKVKVIYCDEKHNPISELVPYYGSHDTSAKVRQQIAWSRTVKTDVWTEIVTEKVRQQMYHLRERGFAGQADLLAEYLAEIGIGDESNREGHAAKVYFNALFGLDFSRSADCSINAALNYGYDIVLSAFNREIVSNGYITQLGLFHSNMFNPFNLASDLMEPYRVLVDRCVCEMRPEQFEHEEKMQLVNVLNWSVRIDEKVNYVSNAIKIYCKSVFDALNDCEVSHIKFFSYEF